MIIWEIYLIGFAVALCLVPYVYAKWCDKNGLYSYQEMTRLGALGAMLLFALGSWLTVGYILINEFDDNG